MHVNLLPAAFRKQALLRRSLFCWIIRWSACLLVCATYLFWEYRQVARANAAREEIEAVCEPVRLALAETAAAESQLEALIAKQLDLRRFTPNNRPLAVLALLSRIEPGRGQLQIQRIDFEQTLDLPAAAGSPLPRKNEAKERGRLILNGIALNDVTVAAFIDALRAIKVIRRVELQSSTRWEAAGRNGRKFDVVCSF